MAKAQLRHIAVSVRDKERTAKFYEDTFGFKRISESEVATRLTDGVVNLTFLQFRNQDDAGDERGKDFVGCITSAYGWIISKARSSKSKTTVEGFTRDRPAHRLRTPNTNSVTPTALCSTSPHTGGMERNADATGHEKASHCLHLSVVAQLLAYRRLPKGGRTIGLVGIIAPEDEQGRSLAHDYDDQVRCIFRKMSAC